MAEKFLNEHGGGIDFSKGIIKTHPQLESIRLLKDAYQRKKTICIYFDRYYYTHKRIIQHCTRRLRQYWRKREKEYITVTENLFGGFKFPKGKYIAYASIINCNPRFLDSKTFQFFYKKLMADAIYTITHELLHFIFFDFVEKKLKREKKHLSKDQLWDLSEIFNVIMLGSPQYCHIINQKFVVPYPDHRYYLPQFQKTYKDSRNIEEFIKRGIAIIKAKK